MQTEVTVDFLKICYIYIYITYNLLLSIKMFKNYYLYLSYRYLEFLRHLF